MHWGAGREGPLERLIQPQKGADTLQRVIISGLPDPSFISHAPARQRMVPSPLEVKHNFCSPKEGSRRRWGQLLPHTPPTAMHTPTLTAEAKSPQASQHIVELKKTCFKMPSFPSLVFLSWYREAVSHITDGKCLTSEEHQFKDEHALFRNPRCTCSALHWRVSSGLTAAPLGGAGSVTPGQRLVSPSEQTCLARQNTHLGLWKTQVLASRFPCTTAFMLCSVASTSADEAEAPGVLRPLLILMMNVTKLLGVLGVF